MPAYPKGTTLSLLLRLRRRERDAMFYSSSVMTNGWLRLLGL